MFTLGLFYLILYILIFLNLLIFSFLSLPLKILTQHSATTYLILLQKYSVFRTPFLFLIFSLTGLPPVGLFFVKFNILAFILYQTHILLVFLLFFVFLVNMLYYIQLFNIKNFKTKVYSIFSCELFKEWNFTKINNFNSYQGYIYLYFTIFCLGLIFSIFFIYSDIFFILSL